MHNFTASANTDSFGLAWADMRKRVDAWALAANIPKKRERGRF